MNGQVKEARAVTGRMVLIGILAFFGIIFAANGALVFFALDSWPGLSTDKAYEEGLAYNRTLAAASEQAARGWASAVAFEGSPQAGQARVRITGADDTPVAGLDVRVAFRRPVIEGFDVEVRLTETAPGLYAAGIRLPMSGRWHAVLEARRGAETVYRMRHELMVTP